MCGHKRGRKGFVAESVPMAGTPAVPRIVRQPRRRCDRQRQSGGAGARANAMVVRGGIACASGAAALVGAADSRSRRTARTIGAQPARARFPSASFVFQVSRCVSLRNSGQKKGWVREAPAPGNCVPAGCVIPTTTSSDLWSAVCARGVGRAAAQTKENTGPRPRNDESELSRAGIRRSSALRSASLRLIMVPPSAMATTMPDLVRQAGGIRQ